MSYPEQDDLAEFRAVLESAGWTAVESEDDWEDEAFAWVAQRTWINYWMGISMQQVRVYVERGGPGMRVHP